jgi:acyl-CoA dehydrogenase
MAFFNEVGGFLKDNAEDEALKPLLGPLQASLGHLQQAAMWFMNNALAKPDNAGAGATDFMHLLGLVSLGYMWGQDGQGRAGEAADWGQWRRPSG